MAKASLALIAAYCDGVLRKNEIQDYDGAHNGLQVEKQGPVRKIAAAVDASVRTIERAIENEADLLLVHHGLFWGPRHPWTGKNYALLQLLIQSNIAVYSAHLPLDMHARLGNNARLCAALGLKNLKPFFAWKSQYIGLRAEAKLSRTELVNRLERATGQSAVVIPGGSEQCRLIGVVTGGAGSELKQAAHEGVDTFITGEGPHWTFALGEELGINVLYGGHYATETFGVKALATELAKKFKLPWTFIDHPTGL